MQEVAWGVLGTCRDPVGHLIELGQQAAPLATVAGAGLPGQGQPAQYADHRGRVEAPDDRQQLHRRRRVPRQAGQIAEDGAGDRSGEVPVEKRQRVAGIAVGWDCVVRGSGGVAAQHSGEPPVELEPLAGLVVAGAADEGQPRLHLGGEGVQRWRPVQQVEDGRVVGVGGVGQVATARSAPPGPVEPPEDRLRSARTSSPAWRAGSAPVRWRARSRAPRSAPGSAATPGSRRRSRHAP